MIRLSTFWDAFECERHVDRERRVSHLRHPNGSLIASSDSAFMSAAAVLVIEQFEREKVGG